MAYLTQDQLAAMGFRHLGENVRISDRASIYGADQMSIGDNSRIDDFCVVSGKVSIGRNVHVAPLCLVAGGEPGITLGDFSGLAYHVQVFSQTDDYSGDTMTNPTVPAKYKKETKAPVTIGRHVIIGSGAVVFPGVDIAEGCSVGALSLVSKSLEPWSICAGIPAKRVRARRRGLLTLEAEYLKDEGRS